MKLTEREKTIILAAEKHNLMDDGERYYQLGGYGNVPVRYDYRTLPQLGRRGLVVKENGYWKATPTGVATASASGTVSNPNWNESKWKSGDTFGFGL